MIEIHVDLPLKSTAQTKALNLFQLMTQDKEAPTAAVSAAIVPIATPVLIEVFFGLGRGEVEISSAGQQLRVESTGYCGTTYIAADQNNLLEVIFAS